jgi:hypothetical protein
VGTVDAEAWRRTRNPTDISAKRLRALAADRSFVAELDESPARRAYLETPDGLGISYETLGPGC